MPHVGRTMDHLRDVASRQRLPCAVVAHVAGHHFYPMPAGHRHLTEIRLPHGAQPPRRLLTRSATHQAPDLPDRLPQQLAQHMDAQEARAAGEQHTALFSVLHWPRFRRGNRLQPLVELRIVIVVHPIGIPSALGQAQRQGPRRGVLKHLAIFQVEPRPVSGSH